MKFVHDDGGRAAAGYKGSAGDCAARAISIATGLSYQEVYDGINALGAKERTGRKKRGKSDARTGVYTKCVRKFMGSIGWTWVPTMAIGSGCTTHLRASELPKGRIVTVLSRHYAAVVDGVLRDTFDCSRNGTRCVYGYFIKD
jgi:hypothetical protein